MNLDFVNGQQFKAKVKKRALDEHISPQILMQEIVLDEIVERIAKSKYRDNLVLKGGFLIASLLGVDTRSTRDIDTSVTGIDVSRDEIESVFKFIIDMNTYDDSVYLKLERIEDIRSSAEYSGFRIHIKALVFNSKVQTKIDVSTGDVITPKQITYTHHMLFTDESVVVQAYNLETILAEKLETIVTRRELNTRLKDYYDVYMFDKLETRNIDFSLLKKAIIATASVRNSDSIIGQYGETILQIKQSLDLKKLWNKYQSNNEYAQNIRFEDTCDAALDVIEQCGIDK
ncbi:nucleotidyl transferase AbiEii/AbiGii toxin family protein [Pediococcus argentinicus]|uniref:Abortive infection protein AbiGII n=1 Tax=Pediococcus argentinicus TaxID=480391 RepID=A0A0R2N955_9LACO|nr:nucleotidyl transferase AbiEii/AbiGii toxin family protein [Pediococcus argentinicus]KRO22382.1 hypothetical protein IV88_GL001167 [Pediococcus argentinicus]NKZ22878.1 nucleotidyl transferase AbiEii/AbiGii toxin family protein [Pediococcus argentinicus]GEP20156.1 abortive infection protein [Pediococcus argentinicus]